MLRAAIYARYSSDNQRHESIETQYRICEDYCRQKGYFVVAHYKDEAKTGRTTVGRDDFRKMLADAQRDIFDVLVVYTLDRTARQELDYYLYKKELQAAGIKYEYATESFDPSSVDGQFFEGIQVAQAAWYSRKLSVKVRDGKDTNARQFLFPGGTPPLGYDVTPDHHYVINEAEAAAVRLIFKMFIGGSGYGPIIDELNSRGFRTKRGKMFGKNSLHEILANEKYCGTYVHRRSYGKQRRNQTAASGTPNAIPAIISQETFMEAARIRQANRGRSASYAAKSVYLLSGKVFCGECGHSFSGNSYTCRQYRYEFYQCCDQTNHGSRECKNPRIKKNWLERHVVDAILKMLTLDRVNVIVDKALAKYRQIKESAPDETAQLLKQKASAEKRLANLYKMVENGAADEFDLDRMRDIKNQIRAINDKIAAADSRPKVSVSREQIVRYWYRLVAELKMQNRAELIRPVLQKIINRITVYSDRVVVSIGSATGIGGYGGGGLALPDKKQLRYPLRATEFFVFCFLFFVFCFLFLSLFYILDFRFIIINNQHFAFSFLLLFQQLC